MHNRLFYIIDKAKDLFARYGIKSINMDEIAREVGITKKTLYQYIKNKDDLVLKVVERIEKNHEMFFKEIQSKKLNAIQSLMWVNKLLYKMFKDHNPTLEFDLKKYHPEIYHTVKIRGREKLFQAVEKNLRKGKEEGLYRENMKEETIAKLYVSKIDAINENETFTREEMSSSDFLKQLLEYHVRGVASEKGLQLFNAYIKNYNPKNQE